MLQQKNILTRKTFLSENKNLHQNCSCGILSWTSLFMGPDRVALIKAFVSQIFKTTFLEKTEMGKSVFGENWLTYWDLFFTITAFASDFGLTNTFLAQVVLPNNEWLGKPCQQSWWTFPSPGTHLLTLLCWWKEEDSMLTEVSLGCGLRCFQECSLQTSERKPLSKFPYQERKRMT